MVAQGLDSLGAAELLEELQLLGFDIAYEELLSEAPVDLLIRGLRRVSSDRPTTSDQRQPHAPVALSGPQVLWTKLEAEGWGAWASISLCLSMPAALIRAPFLPAIAQSLCDANEAMRSVLVRVGNDSSAVAQRALPDFQLPVDVKDAPRSERDAMRLIEAFEGKECTPFGPSTRALVLASPRTDGRHWLCITMHHVFSDRISMHNLARQVREMISENRLNVTEPPAMDFPDVAIWQNRRGSGAEGDRSSETLSALLARADVSTDRQGPRAADPAWGIFADLPFKAELGNSETKALETLAARLGTTLPLLLHAVSSVLIARLAGDDEALSGDADVLLCHVVSNRERDPALKNIVGCLDTSVPVAVRLEPEETLQSLCRKTHQALAAAHRCVCDLPRGSWITPGDGDGSEDRCWPALIERFAHINITHAPAMEPQDRAADIREHSVQRVQQTRWGLLLRVAIPSRAERGPDTDTPAGLEFRAFSQDRVLAGLLPYCLVELLRGLLAGPEACVPDLPVLDQITRVIDRVDFAAAQIRRASAHLDKTATREGFIYQKLVARQQRWYAHDAQHRLCRDTKNRFIGTAANPFPFTQLDKLKERQFLEKHDMPLPKLLHVLTENDLGQALSDLAPDLPDSFVIKPVGAGHSFGVTLVRNGVDLSRGGVPFDPASVGAEMSAMAERGYCRHEGKVFPFNFSSFLIEDFVEDESGGAAPTDYKVFMIGETFLWLQVHFRENGFNWVAFLDADFRLLRQPAWDPSICWRTHRTLVCTDQAMADLRKPACLSGIVERSRQLARRLGIFVRLDWYADRTRGPLMGEITTFPHILQPRAFYTPWANGLVKSVWQEPDGVAPRHPGPDEGPKADRVSRALARLEHSTAAETGLETFLPSPSHVLWSVEAGITYGALRDYVAGFELAPWGVAPGARVGVLVANGVQLAALLLATMNRYVAVPTDTALPAAEVATQAEQGGVCALIVIAGSKEARTAYDVARQRPDLSIIELTSTSPHAPAALPRSPAAQARPDPTPTNGLDDDVLVLRTSGATGEPKSVTFTLARLMRSGAMIGGSLDLSPTDVGISMLPLHHIGGIACNLAAPLLASAAMRHHQAFDPKAFFDGFAGPQGASWCYLVPAMWTMVLDYARAHPELRAARPWPRLRAIRSAGAELPDAVARDLADLFGEAVAILPTYGMTEAMPIAAPPASYRLERPGSVGCVLPSVSVEIVDPTDATSLPPVANGIVGEITVKGPCVFDGYAETPAKTPDIFTPRGYFRTGDLGSLAADGSGWLRIEGRIKDTINVGGETIAPAEIEAVMIDCPVWADGAPRMELMAFARAHRDLGEDVALAVAGVPADTKFAEIYQWATERLPAAKVPKTLVHLSQMPRSGIGKLKRTQFAEQFSAQASPGQLGSLQSFAWHHDETSPRLLTSERVAPAQGVHPTGPKAVSVEAVLEVIRSLMGAERQIGPDTSLEDAGVNSLAAVELSMLLSERFQLDLPSWILSDHPTPRDLHSAILGLQAADPDKLTASDTGEMQTGVSVPVTRGPPARRMLFLHGEGADADLMAKSLRATHWTERLSGQVEFIFMDAPHVCAPMPAFHSVAVDAGLYNKPEYRSWRVTHAETLQRSLSAVREAMEDHGEIDAIGGICDGALVAALTALERPDIGFFLSMSPSPIDRLDRSWDATQGAISCRSVHLVSGADEQHSLSQQLEIAERCQSALIRQHDRGHAVPRFTDEIEWDILNSLDRTAGARDVLAAPKSATLDHIVTGPRSASGDPVSGAETFEPIVAKYMASVLRQAHVDRNVDFFDAGGDSLKAMTLVLKLEKKLGMDLPFELLFSEGASVESLARAIARRRQSAADITVSPIGPSVSEREIFALPTLNGQHNAYLALADALAGTARLVGVKPQMLGKGAWTPSNKLQDIAREAAIKVSSHTDRKKVDLVGVSAGGVLAFETARVLAELGYDIGCLAIIDADFTSDSNRWPVPVRYLTEWQKHLSRRLRGKSNFRRGYRHLHFRAQLADWKPEPVKASAPIFFKAEAGGLDDRQIGMWRSVIDGDLEVVPISGAHDDLVLPEVAEQIARPIREQVISSDREPSAQAIG
ncbi:MAG: AMP-binding protein [Paracoccaceae bacterium]